MNNVDYYIILYTIIIGLTVILYIKKWGKLFQIRQHAIYITVPLLWSCIFLLLLLKIHPQHIGLAYSQQTIWGLIGTTACYYWIGILLFPSLEQFDPHNQFAYLDYYEHFRKQHQWIMGFALLAFLLEFSLLTHKAYLYTDYLIIALLGLALFTEHKGLMCLLAWALLSLLVFV